MSSSPVAGMVVRAWRQAAEHRPWMALYVVLFCCAQLLSLAEPYVIGLLINGVQAAGSGAALVDAVRRGALAFGCLQLAFWCFHGPARVIERWVAFQVRARYRLAL